MKIPRGRPKTRWADSIKHDLNYAGLDTTNAAHMVFDRPQWKAIVSGLSTLEPEQGSIVRSTFPVDGAAALGFRQAFFEVH